jgi:cytochrome c oxidase assembly protein subunit 11
MRKPARRTVWILTLVVAGMFGFGYALVPLYRAVCQLTGLNGRSASVLSADTAQQATAKVDDKRMVTVQFTTTVNGGRVWQFAPDQNQIRVHPGQLYTVYFTAQNMEDRKVIGQAVPSVVPWSAAGHLHKTECFCFSRQAFAANERKDMPVRFMIDPALPEEVDTVTLSYTFFDVTETADERDPSAAAKANNVPKT